MNALARRYYEMKRYDDAERCAKRETELAPSYAAYRLLASTYKAKQDDAHWKATLDQAIKLSGHQESSKPNFKTKSPRLSSSRIESRRRWFMPMRQPRVHPLRR